MATAYANAASTVNNSTWRMLAWAGVALQGVALFAVWWLERWGGLWTIGGFFVASLVFMLVQDRLPSLLSFLIVVAALLNAGGWAWNWYDQFIWFDEFIHFFTAFVGLAALGYVLWVGGHINAEPGSGSFILRVALIGLALGIAWEIVESFFLNLVWLDTIMDLVIDTAGAAFGGWLAAWVIREQGASAAV